MTNRLWLFLIIFTGINLVFVPLLSLYGLRVCPVLSVPGFGFGCYYSGIYILTVSVFNILLIISLDLKAQPNKTVMWLRKNRIKAYAGAYCLATTIALILLQQMLDINHLAPDSRGPEILVLASFLLGITQSYGLNWVHNNTDNVRESEKLPSFLRLWAADVFRSVLPLALVAVILLHFLTRQSERLHPGHTAPIATNDQMIEQTSYLILFLLGWLCITFIFHFLSVKDHAQKVQTHLNHLQKLDFKYSSKLTQQTWGIWAAIIRELNLFSQALGERTRLFKSFSRFVTAGVAEQALEHELSVTQSSSRELTVLMSDIRNFTGLSEKLSPDQVVFMLNEYFTAMLGVIGVYQIQVDKFIGDGILAYVDVHSQQTADPAAENRLAVNAGLAMIARLNELNAKFALKNLPAINIGIGIYRGPLVIGLIGSELKLQHTIIGDTVNRSARLEGLCKELGMSIIISESIWQSLAADQQPIFKSYGKKVVKGITDPIEIFGGPVKLQTGS